MVLAVMAAGTTVVLAQEQVAPWNGIGFGRSFGELNKARRNANAKAFSELFARGETRRVGTDIVASGRDAIEKVMKDPPLWTEVTPPIIGKESVHFVSSDVALVDATETRFWNVRI
jgi:hypothetical protein